MYIRCNISPPLGKGNAILDKLLNTSTKNMPGSKVTVQAANNKYDEYVSHGASWRYIYNFSDKNSYHIVGSGQSGHFKSKFYKNQFDNWLNGTYTIKNINNIEETHKLILSPKK